MVDRYKKRNTKVKSGERGFFCKRKKIREEQCERTSKRTAFRETEIESDRIHTFA